MPVDDADFQAAMDAMLVRVRAACLRVTGQIGLAMEAGGKARAPVRRGTLRRSVHTEGPFTTGASAYARVGPATVYARRIELGFYNMRDSLGRLYHQRPHPYFLPAVVAVRERAPAMIATAIGAAQRG